MSQADTHLPEFKDSRAQLEAYFRPIVKLLTASKKKRDVAWTEAWHRLIFKEEHGTSLGYGNAGSFGKGIGPELAEMLVDRAKEIIDLGIDASEMFELIGLFQERFGPDLLSDMAVAILKERFLAYTQRVTLELNLKPQKEFSRNGVRWILPLHPDGKTALIFVPAALLTKLPLALDRSEIDEVAVFNKEVRALWNAILAAAAEEKREVSKTEIRELLFDKSKNLADLIDVYRNAAASGYDFEKDPDGLLKWDTIGRAIAGSYPLDIQLKKPTDLTELRQVVWLILEQFKRNVENNKLYQVLYSETGRAQKEVFAQRLFFSVADTYCEANNVDVSREPDAGNGPVDFKLSVGYNARILVEVKKSSNPDLLHGFETQLPSYQMSEATMESVYLILRVTEKDSSIKSVLELREKKLQDKMKVPAVFVVDARPKQSASKRGKKAKIRRFRREKRARFRR